MHSLFRRSQAVRGHTRQRMTWEERTQAALAAAREVEENSGESVPTRPSEVNAARRLCYGPRYVLPGTLHGLGQAPPQQREEACAVLQANMALDVGSLHIFSLMMDADSAPDAVTQSPYYALSFVVNTLVPLTINLHWLATEEWGLAAPPAYYPYFSSRVNCSRTYVMEPGLAKRFTLPRTDWLEPDKEPYRTLLSSDWQARNTPLPRRAPSVAGAPPLLSTADAGVLQAVPVEAEGIELDVLQPHRVCSGSDSTSEIQEVSEETQKAPAYGLIIELVDRYSSLAADTQPPSQISYVEFFKDGPSHVVPRCIKQKLCVGNSLYLQHEIFGLAEALEAQSDGAKDDPMQCAICLSDDRDTVMLPCRHLCMCRECANTYRQQSNKCPICRTVVESILHIETSDISP
ncbi:hypothetical protein H4R24_004590 [Coemansia sp. RSA 988]|nr:hypothetical protein H4R24_004590 [Coemansia sp. RSA 988]